jgi:hypothetical protein
LKAKGLKDKFYNLEILKAPSELKWKTSERQKQTFFVSTVFSNHAPFCNLAMMRWSLISVAVLFTACCIEAGMWISYSHVDVSNIWVFEFFFFFFVIIIFHLSAILSPLTVTNLFGPKSNYASGNGCFTLTPSGVFLIVK